jgi:hypothetical protein
MNKLSVTKLYNGKVAVQVLTFNLYPLFTKIIEFCSPHLVTEEDLKECSIVTAYEAGYTCFSSIELYQPYRRG